MPKKTDLPLNGQPLDSEPEIFGRPRTREEIKAEQKARRAQEMAALREARRQAKAAAKAHPGSKKSDLLVMGIFLLAVLVFGAVWIGSSIARDNQKRLYSPSETNTATYYNPEATPALESDGISVAINEIYYTVGGHLAVGMTLGNGTDRSMTLDSLDVSIYNAQDALVASGYTESIDEAYRIAAGGYNTYTLYIMPEHVKITTDTLDDLSYQASAVGTQVEE